MTIAEYELAMIGFASERQGPPVWCTKRIEPPIRKGCEHRGGSEPASSSDLMYWRTVLAQACRSAPYRITRIAS